MEPERREVVGETPKRTFLTKMIRLISKREVKRANLGGNGGFGGRVECRARIVRKMR